MKSKITKKIPRWNGKRCSVAIMFTLVSCVALFAQQNVWIDVTDTYLKNADFSTGTNEGWTDGTSGPKVDGNWKNAEYYKRKDKALQKVFGLKAGNYKLTVRGFHRMKGPDNGAAYNDGTEKIEAYLVAGENEVPFVSLYSAPKVDGLPGLRDGWPNSMESQMRYCETYPDAYNNVLEFTVVEGNGEMLIGVDMRGGEWTCWDDFKLYFDGVPFEAFTMQLDRATVMRDSLNKLGVPACSELTTLINTYSVYTEATPAEELVAAETVLKGKIEQALSVCTSVNVMLKNIETAENIYAKMEGGVYTVPEQAKANLKNVIDAAKATFLKATLDEVTTAVTEGIPAIEEMIKNSNSVIGLSYSLQVAKNLADRIGGLSDTEAYQKVLADLSSTELTYNEMVTDVDALNAVCREKMTGDFLGTASADNPIDMTSFITNPNIFQDGEKADMPGGWTMIERGSSDNKTPTLAAHADTELHCSSWSDNAANNICKGHYQQLIGKEGGVALPDGLYTLSAATHMDAKETTKIWLYATSDSVNFYTSVFNWDADVYSNACNNLETTTDVQNVIVVGGKLYIGVKGEGYAGKMGANWRADNFRLSYVGSDALSAYRERLVGRLEEGIVLHDSLVNYGIDDYDYLGWAVDEEEGYWTFLEEGSGTAEEIMDAINDMDVLIPDAKKVITQYLAFTPLVVKGNDMMDALNNGSVFAQPAAKKAFNTALVNAAVVAEDMTWKNYVSEEVGVQINALDEAFTALKQSIAICYPMGTAIILANQIGGLSETAAYKDVMYFLNEDELDAIDVDMAVKELQAVCIEAMTPEVLAKATEENPFNMTTFVVNPNIYQDAMDDNEQPIASRINGWICETNADGTDRTEQKSGDTWLYCYSWSSNDAHNISSATDYRQVVGTQIGEEGKFALPTGTYRLEAATFLNHEADKMSLYAQTNNVKTSTVPDINGNDSIVYTYTEDQFEKTAFNGNEDVWNAAQAEVGTTTVVSAVYVDKGAVTIGLKGEGRVGGNGSQWWADNFRLYYVNAGNVVGVNEAVKDAERVESEFVDVYNLTGMLVRKQVKRADAMKGLKNGVYIVDGKKYVVAGN